MTNEWLAERLKLHQDQPDPEFALGSTVHWMRGLSMLVTDSTFSIELKKYEEVERRKNPNPIADTYVFEQLLMAFHNLSFLKTISDNREPYPVVRAAIVSWYYAIFQTAGAMIASTNNSTPENHAGTAKLFYHDLVSRELVCYPFSLHLVDLRKEIAKEQIKSFGSYGRYPLKDRPTTIYAAKGAVLGYLSGMIKYRTDDVKKQIRLHNKEYRKLNTQTFGTKIAREIRDSKLRDEAVGFLHQAFRYRGKANYRDCLYLSYGEERTGQLAEFISDLYVVAEAFVGMGISYCRRRVDECDWEHFVDDIERNRRIDFGDILRRL